MTSRREFLTYSALTGIGSLLPATLPAFPGMQTKRRGMRRLQARLEDETAAASGSGEKETR